MRRLHIASSSSDTICPSLVAVKHGDWSEEAEAAAEEEATNTMLTATATCRFLVLAFFLFCNEAPPSHLE